MDKTRKNLAFKWGINITLVLLFLVILFVPTAKAFLIRGLMEIGLFNPTVESKNVDFKGDLSAIRFKDAKGKVVSLADLKGKIIFLNFWATWCPPCLAEMPSVNRFYKEFESGDEIVFIMVDADGDFGKAQAYMDRKGFKLPIYTIASNIPKEIFKGSLPTTVVFDKKGRISFQGEGAADYSSKKFIDFIKKLKTID
jgi:thiol-disulfide isomerase/thioredoxin